MAECEWAILCDYAFLDSNRKTCIIGAFDRIFAASVPSVLHQSALAVKFLGEPDETVNFKLDVIRPTGGELLKVEGSVQLGDKGAADVQLNIVGLALPDYGAYAFNIYEGDAQLKTITFQVAKPPQAAEAKA